MCGLFLVLYGTRTSNPVGCYECAGERYVDIVGVTVRKYAYEYGTSRMRNIKRFFVGTYGTRTGSGPHGLLTVNIPAWVRMVRDTREFFSAYEYEYDYMFATHS